MRRVIGIYIMLIILYLYNIVIKRDLESLAETRTIILYLIDIRTRIICQSLEIDRPVIIIIIVYYYLLCMTN